MDVFTPASSTTWPASASRASRPRRRRGEPDVAAVGFSVDGGTIVTGGFDITKTVRYRNLLANPRATIVIDDLASVDPWAPRGVKVRGAAAIEEGAGGLRIRIAPDVGVELEPQLRRRHAFPRHRAPRDHRLRLTRPRRPGGFRVDVGCDVPWTTPWTHAPTRSAPTGAR